MAFKTKLFIATTMVTMLMSCSSEDQLLTMSEDRTSDIAFSEAEIRYLDIQKKGNSISAQEAINDILGQSDKRLTRANNDLELAGVLYKEELGTTAGKELLPDTLAYCFVSKSQGQRYFVSADNRTQQTVLAEINATEEDEITETGETIKQIIRQGVTNYVRNEIVMYEAKKDSIVNEVKQKLKLLGITDTVTIAKMTRGHVPGPDEELLNPYIEEEVVADWHEIDFQDAMIPVEWDQNAPYNNHIKDTLICENGKKVPTGCVATAVAQLMAKWHFPQYSDTYWNDLTEYNTINQFSNDTNLKNKVAALMKDICIGCNTIFGCGGSSSTIGEAVSFLQSIGYTCGAIQSYTSGTVLKSLKNGCPVLVNGFNDNYIGHMWDIDGYYKKEKTIMRYFYAYNLAGEPFLVDTQTIRKYKTMYHHNWGFGQFDNGWLVDTSFNKFDTQRILTRNSESNDGNLHNNVTISANIHP